MKRLGLWACMGLVIGACHASRIVGQVNASDFYGAWTVTKINAVGRVSESEERMNALVGTVLTITADKVIEAGEDPCPIVKPYPIVSVVDTLDEVPVQAAPSPAAAGLPARAPMLDSGCLAIFKVGDHIVFGDRGAYYEAERSMP